MFDFQAKAHLVESSNKSNSKPFNQHGPNKIKFGKKKTIFLIITIRLKVKFRGMSRFTLFVGNLIMLQRIVINIVVNQSLLLSLKLMLLLSVLSSIPYLTGTRVKLCF